MSTEEQRGPPPPAGGEEETRRSRSRREKSISKESSTSSSISPPPTQQQPEGSIELESAPVDADKAHLNESDDSDSVDLNNWRNTDMSTLLTLAEQLETANSSLDSKLQTIDEQLSAKQGQISAMEAQVAELQSQLERLTKTQTEEAAALISAVGRAREGGGQEQVDESSAMAHAAEIENQIRIYEQLKADEKAFKRNCNAELKRLSTALEQTRRTAEDENISDAELQAQLEKAERKVEAGREELGNINRKLGLIQRQIEQIPHRVELREYRLRFTELYNQVSATHRQTKQYFSLYNSLEDSKRYLEKEHSLLNSIIDSYQEAGSTAAGREEFLKQLSHIHDGLKETSSKVERRYKSEKVVVDKLQADLQHLLDQKVNYERCLKELDADCKLNERLLTQLKQSEAEEQLKAVANASSAVTHPVAECDS